MLTSAQLKQITAEARPIIERQLDDALKLAGLRDVVAAAGDLGDAGEAGDRPRLRAALADGAELAVAAEAPAAHRARASQRAHVTVAGGQLGRIIDALDRDGRRAARAWLRALAVAEAGAA